MFVTHVNLCRVVFTLLLCVERMKGLNSSVLLSPRRVLLTSFEYYFEVLGQQLLPCDCARPACALLNSSAPCMITAVLTCTNTLPFVAVLPNAATHTHRHAVCVFFAACCTQRVHCGCCCSCCCAAAVVGSTLIALRMSLLQKSCTTASPSLQ